jgi:23S rRNA (uracil1939-C5)-methyltransferase
MARKKKLPKQLFDATIDTLSNDGKGIAFVDGKTTFIKEALPNEQVKFKYQVIKKDYAEGVAEEISNPSNLRVIPKCEHYFMCGGCNMQHVACDEQVSLKQKQLLDLLKHIGKVNPDEILEPIVADKWGYRHKARLSVRFIEKKQQVLVGFREAHNPRFIAEINQCEILAPSIGKKISELKQVITQLNGFKTIAQVEVSIGDEETALIFRHLEPLPAQDVDMLIEFSKNHGFQLYLQPKGPETIHRVWPTQGDEFLSYQLDDIKLFFHPTDFTQVNPSINRLMVNKAIELLAPQNTENVLDLFCGLGNFSLPMARHCAKLVGVEGSEEMVKRAEYNAAQNSITNTSFFAADLTKKLTADWALQEYDKLLIDPPRSGAKEIVENIEQFNPKRIVYVSCNPATLARDSDILVNQKGYRLLAAGVMDMFAQTAHVESMAVFEK